MPKYLVLDTETTGISSKDQIVELSWIKVPNKFELAFYEFENVDIFLAQCRENSHTRRYKPSVPIHPKAQEVHGISYSDLLTCRPSKEATLPDITEYIICHNASFDHRMLGKPNVKTICTLELVRFLDKKLKLGCENHKLDTLMAFFYKEQAKPLLTSTHNAFADCVKTLLLVRELLTYLPEIYSWEDLYCFQQGLRSFRGRV